MISYLVQVAESPPVDKELSTGLIVCSNCNLSIS